MGSTIQRDIEIGRWTAVFRFAMFEIMSQRINTGGFDIRLLRKIIIDIERGVRIYSSEPAAVAELNKRVTSGS